MMFELWMDREDILDRLLVFRDISDISRIAGHWKDRSQKLPAETIKQMAKSQHFLESIGTKKVIGTEKKLNFSLVSQLCPSLTLSFIQRKNHTPIKTYQI